MRLNRPFLIVIAALTLMCVMAGPAMAAAPANDVISGAVPLVLGVGVVQDTSEATTDALDAELNNQLIDGHPCGAPGTEASVWYTYTAEADGDVIALATGDTFSPGVIVASGDPANLKRVTCGPVVAGFYAEAGTTYHILAFDPTAADGIGGQLSIAVREKPPLPTVNLTIDPTGYFDPQTGAVTVHGTYSCNDAMYFDFFGELTQQTGRTSAFGYFSVITDGQCDGQFHPWTAEVEVDQGAFVGGKTANATFFIACGTFECDGGYLEQTIKLRGSRS